MMSKEVPVQLRLAASAPTGYRLEVTPNKLRITGPEDHVREITSAETDPVDLRGVTQNADLRVNTYVADPQVRFEVSPIVTVKVTVDKIGQSK